MSSFGETFRTDGYDKNVTGCCGLYCFSVKSHIHSSLLCSDNRVESQIKGIPAIEAYLFSARIGDVDCGGRCIWIVFRDGIERWKYTFVSSVCADFGISETKIVNEVNLYGICIFYLIGADTIVSFFFSFRTVFFFFEDFAVGSNSEFYDGTVS